MVKWLGQVRETQVDLQMEVRSAIAKLTEDLQHFKSIIRNLNETNQQEALNVLDAVIASDRVMQQAISKGTYLPKSYRCFFI